jgi:hypothetical protein
MVDQLADELVDLLAELMDAKMVVVKAGWKAS